RHEPEVIEQWRTEIERKRTHLGEQPVEQRHRFVDLAGERRGFRSESGGLEFNFGDGQDLANFVMKLAGEVATFELLNLQQPSRKLLQTGGGAGELGLL